MVAEALYDWLPCVIQAAEPWMSEWDITPGDRWSVLLAEQLEDAHFGIICLTPENLNAPWIHFEAGALSKVIGKSHVCPYLFDLDPKKLDYPLAQFQAIKSDEEGTKKLVYAVNNALEDETRLPDEQLSKIYLKWWPDLDAKLKDTSSDLHDVEPPKREIDDMFSEIIELVRSQSDKLSRIHFEIQSSNATTKSNKNKRFYDLLDKRHELRNLAFSVSQSLQEKGIVVENEEIIKCLDTLIDKSGVPSDEATVDVVNYYLMKHGEIS